MERRETDRKIAINAYTQTGQTDIRSTYRHTYRQTGRNNDTKISAHWSQHWGFT
jgi:hypothetical protein